MISDDSRFPGRPPSRLSGEGPRPGPPPSDAEAPWVDSQGKPVPPFLGLSARFHRGGYGAPTEASPLVLGRSPPLTHPGFRRPLGFPTAPGTPRGSRASFIAPARAQEDALRGSRVRSGYAPPCRLRYVQDAFFALSPYEVPELGVLQARPGFHGPQAGWFGEEREFHPPLFDLAIVGPPVVRVGARAGLPPGPTPSRAHDHRPPPHASWGYGFTPSRGGDSHPLSPDQPSGFAPRTLSASPNV